jgi:hypothetical protein
MRKTVSLCGLPHQKPTSNHEENIRETLVEENLKMPDPYFSKPSRAS